MRVLFITAEPPWPMRGGASMRAYHLLVRAAQHHLVVLACLATARQTAALRQHLGQVVAQVLTAPPPPARPLWWRAAATLTDPAPDLAYRAYQPLLAHTLARELQGGADIVHAVGLETVGALMGAGRALPALGRLVLDELNTEYLLQQRAVHASLARPAGWPAAAYSWVQARKLRAYETRALQTAARVLAVSEADAAALRRLAPRAAVDVVPNGVDTARYVPAMSPPAGRDVVFSGTMDFRPNVDAVGWFVAEVWPRVLAQDPEARFIIVGRNPVPAVRRLAGPSVVVTGAVDDDLPYLQRAAVYVVPMRFGGGSRLKLLQALSCGLPIVSTAMGAEGVDVAADQHLLVADGPNAFADAILRLLRDRPLAARLGAAAREAALRYDWDLVAQRLLAAYDAALAGATP